MEFWIGVTDNDWFSHLAAFKPDEVAFWHPSGQGFGAVPPGAPFLFKLKSPNNHVAGGGYFSVSSKQVTLRWAWDAFREKIGAQTFEAFRDQIAAARKEEPGPGYDPEIAFRKCGFPPRGIGHPAFRRARCTRWQRNLARRFGARSGRGSKAWLRPQREIWCGNVSAPITAQSETNTYAGLG
jgi:hypothetical protein